MKFSPRPSVHYDVILTSRSGNIPAYGIKITANCSSALCHHLITDLSMFLMLVDGSYSGQRGAARGRHWQSEIDLRRSLNHFKSKDTCISSPINWRRSLLRPYYLLSYIMMLYSRPTCYIEYCMSSLTAPSIGTKILSVRNVACLSKIWSGDWHDIHWPSTHQSHYIRPPSWVTLVVFLVD